MGRPRLTGFPYAFPRTAAGIAGPACAALAAVLLAAPAVWAAPDRTGGILALVRALESPEGYDGFERRIPVPPPRPLTRMTLGEVLSWQSRARRAGAPSTAAGGYQIIHATLERLVTGHRLDRGALFDPAMQDRLARLLVAECGDPGPPARHPRFADCLAGIWAALPLATGPRRGRSAYHGIAGNRALVRPDAVLAVLAGRPADPPRAIPRGGSRDGPPAAGDRTVLAFGAVRLGRIPSAMRGAARAGTLTPSVRDWSLDPYAVD